MLILNISSDLFHQKKFFFVENISYPLKIFGFNADRLQSKSQIKLEKWQFLLTNISRKNNNFIVGIL